MTPAAAIAALDRQIAAHGQNAKLERLSPAALGDVRVFFRGYRPEELSGGIQQGDSAAILSPTSLRASGLPGYQRIIAREQQAIGRDKRINGRIDPVTLDGIMARAMADAILLDWRGLTGADDQPEPYTKELATQLLTNPDFRPFQEAVSWAANVVQDARAERTEEAVGNSASA